MKTLAITLLLMVPTLVCKLPATAEVLEIPVAIASPDFPDAFAGTDFTCPVPVEAITTVALRLEGTYQEVAYVDVSSPYDVTSLPVHLDLMLGDDVAVGAAFTERHQFPPGSGSFSFEVTLMQQGVGDWTFLADGAGQLGLACGPATIQSYDGQIAGAMGSWGAVSAATLLITYDPALPAGNQTWSSLKALYR